MKMIIIMKMIKKNIHNFVDIFYVSDKLLIFYTMIFIFYYNYDTINEYLRGEIMNKKQIIKEQKRLKKERKEASQLFSDDKEVYNVFKIAIGVILFLAVSYLVVNILRGNFNFFNKGNLKSEDLDSSMVMVGTMFNKSDSEYLVLAYDMSDELNGYYPALVSTYNGSKTLYKLDLSSGFNSSFVGNESVINSDLTKLKLSGPTLLVIKGDKIVSSYTKEADIEKYLKNEK